MFWNNSLALIKCGFLYDKRQCEKAEKVEHDALCTTAMYLSTTLIEDCEVAMPFLKP